MFKKVIDGYSKGVTSHSSSVTFSTFSPSDTETTNRDIVSSASGVNLLRPCALADARFRMESMPTSIQEARELLAPLSSLCCSAKWFQVELMTSELMTNALVHRPAHEAKWVDLQLYCTTRMIQVTVINPGTPFIPRADHEPELDDTGGRGLWLINTMAEAWGVDDAISQETQVWFTSSLQCSVECNDTCAH